MARASRSTAITRSAPSASSARVSPPGPGPISSTVTPASAPAARRDAGCEIEIEQKVLSERFFGDETVAANDVAQRRQAVAGLRSRCRKRRGLSAKAKPRRQPQRGDQARRIGFACAGDVEGGAMIG